jgi:hypothetical protein
MPIKNNLFYPPVLRASAMVLAMQFRVLFVAIALMPVLVHAASPNNSDFVQPLLDRVAKMHSNEQRAWLQRLEDRAVRAAKLTLAPADAAQQQARIHVRLHQSVISWQILREVIEDTNQREKESIDRQVRRYRGLVFDAFHKQLDVYGQRQQAWLDTHLDWKLAGSRFEQQDKLIDWLELAIRSVTPGAIGPIPAKPYFDNAKNPAEAATTAGNVDSEPAAKAAAKVSAADVEIKADELAARIAGNNLALRALETELDEKGDWTAARLEPLADRLRILVIRRNDLRLFREAVAEDKRKTIEPLISTKSAAVQIAARITEARRQASNANFHGDNAERQAELKRLDELSRRLAELADK